MSTDGYRYSGFVPLNRNESDGMLAPVSQEGGRPTVLIVDDEASILGIVRNLLQNEYEIRVAADGVAAVEVLRAEPVDLVLTDLRMPRMSGLDLIQTIRADDALRNLPVIIMTGLGDSEAGEMVKAGADDYIIKPFTPAMLRARVSARMEIARLRQEAEITRQRATTILEGVTDGFVAFDRTWCVTHLNPEGERILGRRREELLGKVFWNEYSDFVGTQIHEAYHRAVAEQASQSLEFYSPRLTVWLDVRAYPTADGGLSVFFRDISRRKRAEESARVNEHWFRLMMESAKDYAIFSMDLERHITSWNSGAENLFGYTSDEVLGRKVDILFVPEDRAQGAAEHESQTALERGCSDDERWHLRKDGSRFFASGVVRPIFGPQGEVQGLTKICRDETEQMRNMEALRLSEERFRLLVEGIHDYAILLLDPAGRIVSWNRSAERITGYSEQEIIGRCFSTFFPREAGVEEEFQRILDTAISVGWSKQEGWRVRKDGARFWAICNVAAIRDGNDQLMGFSLITGDISARKEAEVEREQLLETLRANDRRKDEFLAMLAHELRNPLAATKNALAILEMSDNGEDFRWAGHVIQRQIGQLTQLVDDLLDVSRITSGKIRLRKERLNAVDVIAHAVDSVRPLLANRQHELIKSLEPGILLSVEADAARLEQVIVNLLTNAAKYTENGGKIWITGQREGGQVTISVRDTGVGIPPERLPEMFDLFAQGERSIARSEGGLGLGLTIVKTLTEMHGGTVSAESPGVGRGSKFTIRLPVANGSENEGVKNTPAVLGADRGRRILVVDDNVDTARGMSRLLKLLGHTVTMAHDGLEALQVAGHFRPDVVLLDIGLPGLDGYGVASQMRMETNGRDALIIAISGYGQEEDRRRSFQAGFDHHLVKPVDYDELKNLLRTSSRGRREHGQSAEPVQR